MKTKLINIVMFVLCMGLLTWLTACGGGSGGGLDNPGEAVCGNGVIDAGEECDMGVNGDASCSVSCTLISVSAICGNSLLEVEGGEVCEDGNANDGDGCSSTCQFEDAPSAVDADGDGYTATIDCNDGDANTHPHATDIAADGIDQNCVGGDNYLLQRIESVDFLDDGSVNATAVSTYNSTGQVVETVIDVDADGTSEYTHTFAYSDSGKLTQWKIENATAVTYQADLLYDENDQVVRVSVIDGTTISHTTYANSYNSSSQLTKTLVDTNDDGATDECYLFVYDGSNHLVTISSLLAPVCEHVSQVDRLFVYEGDYISSVVDSSSATPTRTDYVYNDAGKVSQFERYLSSDESLILSMELTYDSTLHVSGAFSGWDWFAFVHPVLSDYLYFEYAIAEVTRIVTHVGTVPIIYSYEFVYAE